MQLSIRLLVLCMAVMLALAVRARADEVPAGDGVATPTLGKAGEGTVGFRVGYYHNDDSGDGNPFLDEELTVVEPVLVFDYNATDRVAINGTFSYDYVSSASIDRLSNFPGQSGASGDNYFGLDLGARYQWTDATQLGGHAGLSTEYDYSSLWLGTSLVHEVSPARRFSVNLNAFFDDVDIIRFDGTENEGSDSRTSFALNSVWYQILNPQVHAEVGATYSLQTGFLETPYNAVVVEDATLAPNPNLENLARGFEITEELPGQRHRVAVFGRIRRAVSPRSALELGGRLYGDSWGVMSFAVEPHWYYWLKPETWRARVRYRYYQQTAADDFDDHFFTVPSKRTQDSDLGDFDSHTIGLRVDWLRQSGVNVDVSADYVLRSDGLDQILASVGLHWNF